MKVKLMTMDLKDKDGLFQVLDNFLRTVITENKPSKPIKTNVAYPFQLYSDENLVDCSGTLAPLTLNEFDAFVEKVSWEEQNNIIRFNGKLEY